MTRTIREVEPPDHDELRQIQTAVLQEPSPDLLGAAVQGPLLGLVCLVDGRLVGYVLAVVGENRAYVPELAVPPDDQREGHGTALLAALRERLRARGIETVRVTARASDDRARQFYESRDLAVVDRIPEHYEDGTDGVVYERRC